MRNINLKWAEQKELAASLGVTPQHINAILKGRSTPSASLAIKIEEVARIPKETLRPDLWPHPDKPQDAA